MHKKSVSWHQLPVSIMYDTVEIIKHVNNMEKKQRYFKSNNVWRHITTYKKNSLGFTSNDNIFTTILNNPVLKNDWYECKHKNYETLISCTKCTSIKTELKNIFADKIKNFRLNECVYNEDLASMNDISDDGVEESDRISSSYYGWAIIDDNNRVYVNLGSRHICIYKLEKINLSASTN